MSLQCRCPRCDATIITESLKVGDEFICQSCDFRGQVPDTARQSKKESSLVGDQPGVQAKTATMVNIGHETYGGSESTLAGVAVVSAFLFLLSAAGGVYLAMEASRRGGNEETYLWATMAVASVATAIMTSVMLGAIANIIRLLKKLNGLPYAGRISQGQIWATCSECGISVVVGQTECSNCKSVFK